MKKLNQKGFHHVMVLVVVVILIAIGLVGYKVAAKRTSATDKKATTSTPTNSSATSNPDTQQTQLIWSQGQDGWTASQKAPDCPAQPMLKSPVDMSKVTAILYPGQTRGGNYKPHGGFRFDNQSNDQTVTAPLDGFIVRGSSYREIGEVQYLFDVMNNCGVMYRFDHLRVVTDVLKKIADTWPAPQENVSQTHNVSPAVAIKQGDVLATSIGFVNTKNVGVDWGVYDYRTTNEASKSSSYQQAHSQFKETAWHAVCWFDWLSTTDAAKVRALPAGDQANGKKSDYCK